MSKATSAQTHAGSALRSGGQSSKFTHLQYSPAYPAPPQRQHGVAIRSTQPRRSCHAPAVKADYEADYEADYYDALARAGDDTRAAGWRHPLEQALRFEAALALWEKPRPPSVLDLGCGPAALLSYARDTDRRLGRYIGVDRHPAVLRRAKRNFPCADLRQQDLYEADLAPADVVVASGTLVDGDASDRRVPGDARRLHRLRRLLARCWELTQGYAVLFVLRQERLDARPWLADPALAGAYRGELERLATDLGASHRIDAEPMACDWRVVLWRGPPPPSPSTDELVDRVVTGPRGVSCGPDSHAWLWLETGRLAKAAKILADPTVTGPRAELARYRIAHGNP